MKEETLGTGSADISEGVRNSRKILDQLVRRTILSRYADTPVTKQSKLGSHLESYNVQCMCVQVFETKHICE